MSEQEPELPSFPVPAQRSLIHRRASFSQAISHLDHHFIDESAPGHAPRKHRRHRDEFSSLIEDLTNRPMDPMFSDARLLANTPQSTSRQWVDRIIVFITCVAVGLGLTITVQVLNRDPRQKVREKLISQIQTSSQRWESLNNDITGLRNDIDRVTDQEGAGLSQQLRTDDDILNGATAVKGPGIVLTLSDPIAGKSSKDKNDSLRLISDTDLQWFLTQLWSAGAEAVAINGNRIGTQSSVRLAGQTVLVGTTSIESPYKIEAIGNEQNLQAVFDQDSQRTFLTKLKAAHISLQISSAREITLKAVGTPELTYAKRGK